MMFLSTFQRCFAAFAPHKQVSCIRPHGTTMTAASSSSKAIKSRALFIDTDAGYDDILAISNLLNTGHNIPFISTVGGIQSCTDRSAQFLQKVYPDTRVFPGRSQTFRGDSPKWLLDFRNGLNDIMNSVGTFSVKFPKNHHDSISQIAELLKKYPDQGVDLMCLGPLSNIASWSEDDELLRLIQSKINQIWIMGGNIPGFDDAEFNFAQDPAAVATVLKNDVLRNKIHILPAETCQKHSPPSIEWNILMENGMEGSDIMSKVLNATSSWDDLKYDSLCAFSYAKPYCVSYSRMNVKVNEITGLLLPSTDADDGNLSLKMILDIAIDAPDEDGFLNWLRLTIDPEEGYISSQTTQRSDPIQ